MKSIAFALLAVLGCGKSDSKDNNAPAAAGQPSTAPAAAPVATPPTVADLDPCSLLTADEVGKEFGKTVIAKKEGRHQCEYTLDPAEAQKAMEELEKGGALAIAKSGSNFKMPSAISSMLDVEVSIKRDAESEVEIKNTLAKIAAGLNGNLPEVHGVNNTIEAGKEIPNVGDWAFTTQVASVDMGAGASTRGRLLYARHAALLLTLSVMIAPDPGADKLDTQISDLARSAVAKMK
jgi:hypothetical protein